MVQHRDWPNASWISADKRWEVNICHIINSETYSILVAYATDWIFVLSPNLYVET